MNYANRTATLVVTAPIWGPAYIVLLAIRRRLG